jgi:hypothetical protein
MAPDELPTLEATWWPVQLETVPGSNERVTTNLIARASSGQSQVRQAISPAAIHAMFGPGAKGVGLLIGKTVLSLQTQLDNGVKVEDLALPFGGFHVGPSRDCLARDMNEVFEIAGRLSGLFSASQFGLAERSSKDSLDSFAEWADKVRDQVAALHEDQRLADAFKVQATVVDKRRATIGFHVDDYAASFGVLRPGRAAASDTRTLKVKMFDLEVFRRAHLFGVKRVEVIVGCPDWQSEDTIYRRKELDALQSAWDFIEQEAKHRKIRPVRYVHARDAALHLVDVLQAAR